ncbi:TetR family transcriptional regulator [Agromyces badenianii]|uniref:TetR family transcriptional regulator n=1 Tax=Agromyces badenianii TaxID=2080742 RepID=A0A2S0WSW4_9MICO|nr:TetR/AcrR family transcriptional regulator [Agromyces badenianii]AWB94417.1 TetR family transcriptional regulator [Agromyces badenianii]PWC05781.1 TetR/AcrR family transcriptional regulator [Agromyces badenianii]
MARRGSYAKGVAKREEILTAALDVIARNGYRRTSVRELAHAVGLSQAGLLHYFSSKEELFQEILRKRDEVDTAAFNLDTAEPIEAFLGVIRHNSEVPGLVQLYAQLSTEAGDPEHPSHAFFVERYAQFRTLFVGMLRDEQAAGRLDPDLDLDRIGNLFLAAADGLQTQWMLDRSIDMAEHIAYLWHLVARRD